jgi:hypothetical protein
MFLSIILPSIIFPYSKNSICCCRIESGTSLFIRSHMKKKFSVVIINKKKYGYRQKYLTNFFLIKLVLWVLFRYIVRIKRKSTYLL